MKSSSGNVLFLILIAVALFATLSYAVTKSSRGGGNDISKEKAGLIASQITQYGSSIENAVTRMRISSGCSETDISFENSLTGYDFMHSPAIADKCKVFHPQGGGISYQTPISWFDPTKEYIGGYEFWATADYSISLVGTTAPELTISLWGLQKSVCSEINTRLGINNGSTIPTANPDNGQTDFQGIYPPAATDTIAGSGNALQQRASGCFDYGSDYIYYHVIIPR